MVFGFTFNYVQINLIFLNSLSVHCKDVAQVIVCCQKTGVEGTSVDKSLSNNPYVLVIL